MSAAELVVPPLIAEGARAVGVANAAGSRFALPPLAAEGTTSSATAAVSVANAAGSDLVAIETYLEARLVPVAAEAAGIADNDSVGHSVPSGGLLIGRKDECGLRLHGPTVSGQQCRLSLGPTGSYILEDLSSNGTFVNKQKVGRGNRAELVDGDLVQLTSRSSEEFQFFFRLRSRTAQVGIRQGDRATIPTLPDAALPARSNVSGAGSAIAAAPAAPAALAAPAAPAAPANPAAPAAPAAPATDVGALSATTAGGPTACVDAANAAGPAAVGAAAEAEGIAKAQPAAEVRSLYTRALTNGAAEAETEARSEAERAELLAARRQLRCELAELEALCDLRKRELAAAEAAAQQEALNRQQLAQERDRAMDRSATLAGEIEACRTVLTELDEDAQASRQALEQAGRQEEGLREQLAALQDDLQLLLQKERTYQDKIKHTDECCSKLHDVAAALADDWKDRASLLAKYVGAKASQPVQDSAAAAVRAQRAAAEPASPARPRAPATPQGACQGGKENLAPASPGDAVLISSLSSPVRCTGATSVAPAQEVDRNGAAERSALPARKRRRQAASETWRLMPAGSEAPAPRPSRLSDPVVLSL